MRPLLRCDKQYIGVCPAGQPGSGDAHEYESNGISRGGTDGKAGDGKSLGSQARVQELCHLWNWKACTYPDAEICTLQSVQGEQPGLEVS